MKCCSSVMNVWVSRNLKVPSTSKMPFGMPQQHGRSLKTLWFTDSITCGYLHYFDMTRPFSYCRISRQKQLWESCNMVKVCHGQGSSHLITVKNCLTIDSDASFSLHMTVKYVIWHECEFRWYSDSIQHNFTVEANVSVDSEKLYHRTDLLYGTGTNNISLWN